MSAGTGSIRSWLAAVVVAHLFISVVHGTAHNGAHVSLSPAGTLFVFLVILVGPLVGLALAWRSPRTGYLVVALTMAASLVFGVANHFLIAGTDHVAHVSGPWRPLFAATAVLLALSEGAGAVVALRAAQEQERMQASRTSSGPAFRR